MNNITNVGELKTALNKYSDDMKVYHMERIEGKIKVSQLKLLQSISISPVGNSSLGIKAK